jgi:hypothetical protein
MASPSLLAFVMYCKFVLSLPLYRLAQHLAYTCAAINRENLSVWVTRCAKEYIDPIYLEIKSKLLKEQILHADETTIQVLKEEGRKPDSQSYFWVVRTGSNATAPLVLFNYAATRAGEHAIELLKGAACKFLHTDGYQGYGMLEGIVLVGCWAHMRRHWSSDCRVLSEDQRNKSPSGKVLILLNEIFKWEREFREKELTREQRFQERLEHVKPLADKLFAYVEPLSSRKGSLLQSAITYTNNQKAKLMNAFFDGSLEFTNNLAERSIKVVTIGRKNWLFAVSATGANVCEIMYSVFDTAIENGLNPEKHMAYVLERMPGALGDDKKVQDLLPWSCALPGYVRMKPEGKDELKGKIAEAAITNETSASLS